MNILMDDIVGLKKIDCIVNAANGKGKMGAGVAKAIAQAGGEELIEDTIFKCKLEGGYKAGSSFSANPGNLKFKKVYHAVTMDYPGGLTSLEIVKQATYNTLENAIKDGMKSIAFPGLGTGIGRLNHLAVLEVMFDIFLSYENKIEITFIDRNRKIIDDALIIYEKLKESRKK